MAVKATHAVKNAMLDGMDALFNSGVLEIRTLPQAASASAAPTGTLLWSETVPADAFGAAASGVKAKLGTWSANAVATGQAGWFRLKGSADTGAVSETQPRIDGVVKATGQGGDLELSSIALVSGAPVEVVTLTLSLGA